MKSEASDKIKMVDMQEIYPILQDTLTKGDSFRIMVNGSSMLPTIRGDRDILTISWAPERLRKYDLPLYQRECGHFVIHRVVDVAADGTYSMCGDHQWNLERGIRPDQIVGIVTEIDRKGRHFSVDNRHYTRWVRFWVWALPLRRSFFRLYGLPGRIRRFITRKK